MPTKKNLSRFCMSGANIQNRGSPDFHPEFKKVIEDPRQSRDSISNKIKDFDEIGKIVSGAAHFDFTQYRPPHFRIFVGDFSGKMRSD